MKFTLSWLKDHLETQASLNQICEKLPMLGLEVESIQDRSDELSEFIVGYVEEAYQHPNADRLRVCIVDTGSEKVQVVCGAPNARTGIKGVFAGDSAVLTGGGTKGFVLPDNFIEVIKEFMGVDTIQEGYGMSEIGGFHWACEHGHYHLSPWVIPFVLDPETSEPLPRAGTVTGRAAFYDLLNDSHWGGIISGDEVTIHWDTPCPCGRKSVYLSHDIIRYSDKEGIEDDRISCSATQQVQDEVVNFMRGFE